MDEAATITLPDGVIVEYRLGLTNVVFSHGFGVTRDSRGLFYEIAANLPQDYGYVLFDYNTRLAENTIRLSSLSESVQKLQMVIDWTIGQSGSGAVNIIAHSMGCIVTALAKPNDADKVILLAPPTEIGKSTREYFTSLPGAQKSDGQWTIPRRDGTVSLVDDKFFKEFEKTDAVKELIDYSKAKQLHVLSAAKDEVLTDADYRKLVRMPYILLGSIAEASHNFEPPARSVLIARINQILLG